MLSVHLEDRFRQVIGAESTEEERDDSIRFAVEFTRLLARILPDEISLDATLAMEEAIRARTDLTHDEIIILLDMVIAPENHEAIEENDIRAFGNRFGNAEEIALRAAVAEEVNLSLIHI